MGGRGKLSLLQRRGIYFPLLSLLLLAIVFSYGYCESLSSPYWGYSIKCNGTISHNWPMNKVINWSAPEKNETYSHSRTNSHIDYDFWIDRKDVLNYSCIVKKNDYRVITNECMIIVEVPYLDQYKIRNKIEELNRLGVNNLLISLEGSNAALIYTPKAMDEWVRKGLENLIKKDICSVYLVYRDTNWIVYYVHFKVITIE